MTVAKYIVLTKDRQQVRFFAAGVINAENTFTGIMHDYTGAGNYEEKLVFEDKWIPEVDSKGEALEWDTMVEIFNTHSPLSVDKIEDALDRFICYDTNVFNYVPQNGMSRYFSDRVLIENMSLTVPYGLGNTTFIDGYEINESMEYVKALS